MLIDTSNGFGRITSALCMFILFSSVISAQAQQPNRYVVTPQFTDAASSVHAADLDGDGDNDILSASSRDDKIAWYENFDGEIGSQQVISVDADEPQSVHAADLDGDGDLDVLSASYQNNELAWYENLNGTRDFSSKKIIATDGTWDVFAADLDGDGDMDVLSASPFYDEVLWYENGGAGAFSGAKVISNSVDTPYAVHAADVDSDGDMDILSASFSDDTIAWYENLNGDGSFSSARVISSSVDGAIHTHATDLDGDGDVDVVAAAHLANAILWFENTDGTGTFSAAKTISTTASGAYEVYATDLDGDNDPEVLSATFDNDAINIYDNQIGESGADADGFGPTVQITTNADGADEVYASDLDGDGDADILSASRNDDTISYFENRINEGFGFPNETIVMPSARADGANEAIAVDLNGDGALDIVTASSNDGKLAWHENDGTRWFSPQKVISTSAGQGLDAGDIDGDGDNDLVSTSFGGDTVAWYENTDGAGTFSAANVLSANVDGALSSYLADLDGDGDLDVLAVGQRDDTVYWFENLNGAGSFSSENIIWTAADGANEVIAADIDGDTDLDVIVASRYDDTVAWFENTDGNGAFSNEKVIVDNALDVVDVHPADLDGDGDVDLLYAPSDANVVNWLENTDGDGSFSDPKEITNLVNNPVKVFTADLNRDGRLDVLTASYFDDKIAWYVQTESFGVIDFGDQTIISTAADGAESVFAADLDGDGDTDVLSASYRDDEIAWYENTPTNNLPVEMATFTASASGETVTLDWATASETNNAGFDIERSTDGATFEKIGFRAGAGTTAEAQSYRFVDRDMPFVGELFYRLRQVDVDGTETLSDAVSVRLTPTRLELLPSAPNPFAQTARLRYRLPEPAQVRLEVFDLLGRRVAMLVDGERPAGPHEVQLDGSQLAAGPYFVRLTAGAETKTQQIQLVR
jgi:hypothetical protein